RRSCTTTSCTPSRSESTLGICQTGRMTRRSTWLARPRALLAFSFAVATACGGSEFQSGESGGGGGTNDSSSATSSTVATTSTSGSTISATSATGSVSSTGAGG